MRFISSLIKYIIYLLIIFAALSAALFWFDTGSWLVLPLAQRAGNFFLSPLQLEIQNINGSLRNGYSLEGLRIISGDKDILTLDYASVSPDWPRVFDGMDGLPFIRSLNVQGLNGEIENFSFNVRDIHGTEPDGYYVSDVKAKSGDEELISLPHAYVNPDWPAVMKGLEGIPYVNSLDIGTVSGGFDFLRFKLDGAHGNRNEGFHIDGLNAVSGDEELISLQSAYINADWDSISKGLDGLPFIHSIDVVKLSGGFETLKFRLDSLNGNKNDGFSLSNVKLTSNDKNVLSLNRASVLPDWQAITLGNEGIPFVKSLSISGVRSDLDRILEVVNHFSSESDEDEEENESDDEEAFKLTKINPVNLAVHDVILTTPYANVSLYKLTLDEAGKLLMYTKIISRDNVLPIRTEAKVNFSPLEIVSSDLSIGKGRGNLSARIEPLRARLDFTALSLEELVKFSPERIKASGRIDSRIFIDTQDEIMNASGILSMPRANIMDIPLSFRLPFKWDGGNTLTIDDARLNTNAASVNLNSTMNIESMKLRAKGSAVNLSLTEIGKMFAPEAALKGEGGNITFNVDAVLSGDILGRTNADIKANIPLISAAGINMLRGLNANVNLKPGQTPKISMGGEIFGGKLFARGEALQNRNGEIKPQAVVSIVNLDLNTLIRAFPDAAKSISRPSGKITLNTKIESDLSVTGKVTSDKISANGITLTKLLANLKYDYQKNMAALESFSANLGRAVLRASARANLKNSSFTFNANADNFDPKLIPELKDLSGTYTLKADASGRYTKPESIKANVNLTGRNMAYSGIRLGSMNVPLSFANNILRISDARASLPGGTVNLRGSVNVANASNPGLDISASTQGINLSDLLNGLKLQDKSMPVSGRVRGLVSIRGPMNTASVNAGLYASNVKVGNLANIPNAEIEAFGNMKKVTVKTFSTKVNGAGISGKGSLIMNQKDFMKSGINLNADVKDLELKPILTAAMGQAPAEGKIEGNIKLSGTIAQPELTAKLTSPIYASGQKIEDIAVKLKSPSANHYVINAGARIKKFRPEADIDIQNKNGIWVYHVDSKPLDLDNAIQSQMPERAGMVKGYARINVRGSTKPNSNINIDVNARNITIIDKIKINRVSMPVIYMTSNNKVRMKKGSIKLYDGVVNTDFDLDLNKSEWQSKVDVSHLDFGKLATDFMPEGELIGSVNAQVNVKGNYGGAMPAKYANGKFETTPGYVHKIAMIDRITPTKKISFEKINGTFFWDGNDLFLNPGTGARAGADEPLYRYFTINGSAGVPGKGMKLLCDGRFDLKILDQLLGAMKGVFQYVTGGLTRNVLKDAASRAMGLKGRDFQNVSFTIANSWTEPRIENLKVTKSIEEFLPIDVLNGDEEKQKSEAKFSIRLKIPTGPGEKSVEEESTTDQFKQQLIDNLFNIGL